jgi:WD40 repeat protein
MNPRPTPEELLAAFLEAHPEPSPEDIEALCAEQAEQADELRGLLAAADDLQGMLAGHRQLADDLSPTAAEAHALHRAAHPARGAAASAFRAGEGECVGDFRLLRLIGRGGMGEVWEAEQLSLSRRVALKLLLPERVDQRGLDFFAREARAGGRLAHPGIVSVFGTGEDEGLHWIAMELVAEACDLRHSLEALREEGELPGDYYDQVAEFIAQVADALDVAHTGGVIHRDLKPGNILVTDDDRPKVSDFGLAKLTDEHSISLAGQLVGTFAYMSPEQVAVKHAGIDHRTDVFSLGVVLYEMLTLVRAFEGDTTEQVAQKILWEDPVDPRTLRSKVPQDLAVICVKAMEKDPGRRYGTMAELAADLRRHLANEPIHARPPTALQRAGKWVKRNPTLSTAASIAGVALVLISIVGLFAVRNAKHAERNADLARGRAEQLTITNRKLEEKTALAERRSYSAFLHAAEAALDAGNIREAASRHALCPEPYRGWEWHQLGLRLDQSQRVLKGHLDGLLCVAWSPDGEHLASGSYDDTLRIWDATSGECIWTLEEHDHDVTCVAWSPDGTRFVSGSSDETLRVWDTGRGDSLLTLEGHVGFVNAVAWSPDGTRIVSGSFDTTLRIWDAASGESLAILKGHGSVQQREGWVLSVAWSPDGTRIVSGSMDHTLRIWDAASGECVAVLNEHAAGVFPVAWSPDGTRIASGSWDKTLRIWDARSGESLLTLEGHERAVICVAWSPDGARIASGSNDGTLRIWDTATGEHLSTLTGHAGYVSGVAWSPDGTQIVSGGEDKDLRTWNPTSGQLHSLTLPGPSKGPSAWSPDGTRIVAASYSLPTNEGATDHVPIRIGNHVDAQRDPGGPAIRIWDAANGENLLTREGLKGGVNDMAWSADGARIVSWLDNGTLQVWNSVSGADLLTLEDQKNELACGAWSPDGTRIVCGSPDYSLRIRDAASGASLATLEGHESPILCVAWSPDGTRIVSGSVGAGILADIERAHKQYKRLILWDATTGEILRTLDLDYRGGMGHNLYVHSVAWSPDGSRIAAGLFDATARIFDATDGELLSTLEGHEQAVLSVAWNPEGTRLVSGSMDATLRIWDAMSAECLLTLKGHEDMVISAAWSPDGVRILSADWNKTVRIWDSRLEDALALRRATEVRQRAGQAAEADSEEVDDR